MENTIEVSNVVKNYNKFKLDNISFQVPKGSIVGFIGENGAGKSTTIKAILDLITLDSGSIKVFGLDHKKDKEKIKEDIGVVFDDCSFHENLTVSDINKVMKKIYKTKWDESAYEKYVKEFSLPEKKIIKEYSRGMKMKLSIAVSLSHHAKLLIYDEATSGLDPIVRDEILDILMEFIQDEEHTIFMSSHITSDLEKIADYICMINKGKMIVNENKDDLLYRYGIARGSEEECKKIDSKYVEAKKGNSFNYEILVNNRNEVRKSYPKLLIEKTTLEEIMLMKIRGKS